MVQELIKVEKEGPVVWLTLNREDKLNALNKGAFEALEAQVEFLLHDHSARVVVIIGSGEKAFCVGADLKERKGMNEKDVLNRLLWVREIYKKMEQLPQVVIAAINGLALGGGLELALCCDLRIALSKALLGFPEVGLAIIPGNGGTQRLTRLVGVGRAKDLVLRARRIPAEEAYQWGIVNEVVEGEREKLVGRVSEIAHQLCELGPLALASAKRAIGEGWHLPLDQAVEQEIEYYKKCLYSQDRLEGLKAFAEKRKPEYRGE